MNLEEYLEKIKTRELDNIPTKINAKLTSIEYDRDFFSLEGWTGLCPISSLKKLALTFTDENSEQEFVHYDNAPIWSSSWKEFGERNLKIVNSLGKEMEIEVLSSGRKLFKYKRNYFIQKINGIKLGYD